MTFPTDHPELADCYDPAIINWPAQGPGPGRGGRIHRSVLLRAYWPASGRNHRPDEQQRDEPEIAERLRRHGHDPALLLRPDPVYAASIYSTLKQMAVFWQNYLTWDGITDWRIR